MSIRMNLKAIGLLKLACLPPSFFIMIIEAMLSLRYPVGRPKSGTFYPKEALCIVTARVAPLPANDETSKVRGTVRGGGARPLLTQLQWAQLRDKGEM